MGEHLKSLGVDFSSQASEQENGQTPMHKAAMKSRKEMVAWLESSCEGNDSRGTKRKNRDGVEAATLLENELKKKQKS